MLAGALRAFVQMRCDVGRRGLVRVANQQVVDPSAEFMAIHGLLLSSDRVAQLLEAVAQPGADGVDRAIEDLGDLVESQAVEDAQPDRLGLLRRQPPEQGLDPARFLDGLGRLERAMTGGGELIEVNFPADDRRACAARRKSVQALPTARYRYGPTEAT